MNNWRAAEVNQDGDRLDWSNYYPYFRRLREVTGWHGEVRHSNFEVVHNFWRRHFMLTRSIMDPLFTPLCIRLVDSGIDFQKSILIASFQVQIIRQNGQYMNVDAENIEVLVTAQEEYRVNNN